MKNSTHSMFDKTRVYKSMTENAVIDLLLNWNNDRKNKDLRTFLSGIFYPDQKAYFEYEGFYVTKTILREELQLEKGKKPGDIDVMIIPFTKTKIYFERTSVYEIKIVRPTRKNPSRNANSLGVTQVLGLIDDGFPVVGLIHVSITEPLREEEKRTIKFSTIKANKEFLPEEGKSFEDYFVDIKIDQFPGWSSENQIKRLMTYNLPDCIGISTHGLEFYDDDTITICSCDVSYQKAAACSFNPLTSQQTILKIKNHFLKNREKYQVVLNKKPE
ncbi:hypothetical protein [Chryseobacterium taiwanense]|uniref:hypothetical protein n=1 Tax=Chryseobacterium taiwanense TaxID=363331 RepID=UPI00103C31F8|nr:hypothetical protein [Chryseobacterium taiwanense]